MKIIHTYRQHPGDTGSDIFFDELTDEMKKKTLNIKIITSDLIRWGKHFKYYTTIREKNKSLGIIRIPFTLLRFINPWFFNLNKNSKFRQLDKFIFKFEKKIIRFLRVLSYKLNLIIPWGLFQDELGWKLFLILIKQNFDFIHTTCIPRSCITASLLAAKIKKIPIMITPFYHYQEKRFYENDKFWMRILRNFDCINVCTDTEKDYMIQHGINSKKIIKVGLGVYFDEIKLENDNNWREKLQIENDKFVVLYMNSIISDPLKGVHQVIEAAAKLPEFHFIFAGKDERIWNNMILRYNKKFDLKNCHFVGYVVGKAKYSLFHTSDLIVRPSINEALGIFYLEGMSAGKPIITSNIDSMKEISNNVGFCVEHGNVQELIEKIKILQSNKSLYHEFSKNAIKKSEGYSWRVISRKFERLYDILLKLQK
ncbi:MAG: glycosyltransferase family 4 protein [Promethearchaeota archaeon]